MDHRAHTMTVKSWPVAVLAATLLLATACSTGLPSSPTHTSLPMSQSPTVDWGPLAVIRADVEGVNFGQHVGELRIAGSCVTAGGVLLIWADSQTRWDAARDVVIFSDPIARRQVELADGDQVELAGGEAGQGWPWTNKPDGSCPTQDAFAVNAISSINGIRVQD